MINALRKIGKNIVTLSRSTVKIHVLQRERLQFWEVLWFSQADMLLSFACGDTKSLKMLVHKNLFFTIIANR